MLRTTVIAVMATVALAGCESKASSGKYPGTKEGARQLLTDLREPGADAAAMTRRLQPTSADYQAVFLGDAAQKAEQGYAELWKDSGTVITADAANTELNLVSATSEEIKAWTGTASTEFPGGYRKVGEHLKPGLTFYRWKYTRPGQSSGMAYDGLVFVNGRWVWFPKPWRAFR